MLRRVLRSLSARLNYSFTLCEACGFIAETEILKKCPKCDSTDLWYGPMGEGWITNAGFVNRQQELS